MLSYADSTGVRPSADFAGAEAGLIPAISVPGDIFSRYRHNENNPVWGMDDVNLCSYWRNTGGNLAYLLDYPANHYLTTEGQKRDNPDYYRRKEREFAGR